MKGRRKKTRRSKAAKVTSARAKLASYQAMLFESRELLKQAQPVAAILMHMQIAMGDEVLVGSGGDSSGDRVTSDNPSQCECGTDWDVKTDEQFFANRPAQAQINAILNNLAWPTNSQKCDAPCTPVETFKSAYWDLWQNTKTGQFRLFCSKRKQWHCELAQPTDPT